jgi:hypothetical protein
MFWSISGFTEAANLEKVEWSIDIHHEFSHFYKKKIVGRRQNVEKMMLYISNMMYWEKKFLIHQQKIPFTRAAASFHVCLSICVW